MKAKDVLRILHITRPTLSKYVKSGIIKVSKLPSGQYDYDEKSVFDLVNKEKERINVIYARVSTRKQKNDLENQARLLQEFCNKNGIKIGKIYKDIGSGLDFKRKGLEELLEKVLNYEIENVYITYKDRLSRIGFEMFKNLFAKFGTNIVVLNDFDDEKLIEKEIFEEIINLIHSLMIKVSSKRKKKTLEAVKKQLETELE